jgi:hypothetical protein
MTSNALKYFQQVDYRGGICDNQESLDMRRLNQVLDARNCWAPLGSLIRRPGYQAIAQYEENGDTIASVSYIDNTYDIYFGAAAPFYRVAFQPGGNNTNPDAQYRCDYWNGSAWMPIPSALQNDGALYCESNETVLFVPPADWATTEVDSQTKYWIRYVPAGDTPNVAPGSIGPGLNLKTLVATGYPMNGLMQFKYNTGSNFLWSYVYPTGNVLNTENTLRGGDAQNLGTTYVSRLPLNATVVPEFDLAYVASGNTVYEIGRDNSIALAEVNSDELIIGTDPTLEAPYNAALIALSAAFPAANYIINFRNLIFAAGFADAPILVRWSGAVNEGAYNVWPETSFETLSTAKDNSPITALAPLGDNLVVFKENSIWQLVFDGLDDLNLPAFIPQLVVTGVGCVSQGSVQEVRGRLVFLAEDGFYAFDGTPNIRKISENINATTQRINPAHRNYSTAVNWRSKYCYLCSTAMDESSTNNVIFVYDYKHDAWWIWDSIPAEFMFVVSDTALQEQLIFGNTSFGVFQLIGETDNFGDIDNYILTGRFGQDELLWKKAREVRLRGQNIDGTIPYTLYSDDLQLGVTSKNCRLDSPLETQADPEPDDGCDNVPIRRRERKMPQLLLGEWFQVKVEDFRFLEGLNVGYVPESRR